MFMDLRGICTPPVFWGTCPAGGETNHAFICGMVKTMEKDIIRFGNSLANHPDPEGQDPASVKQGVMLRIFSYLGWDIFNVDQVCPEFSIKKESMDFCLKTGEEVRALIWVKKPGALPTAPLEKSPGFPDGPCFFVFTTGVVWRIFISMAQSDMPPQEVGVADLAEKPEKAADLLVKCLSFANCRNGRAMSWAEEQVTESIRKAASSFLPQAWRALISGPDPKLVGLLADTVKKISGFPVETEPVAAFIRDIAENRAEPGPPAQETKGENNVSGQPSGFSRKPQEDWSGKTLVSFTFNKKEYPVSSWSDLLPGLCEIFLKTNAEDFEKVLWLSGHKQSFFSKYDKDLRLPKKIGTTGIYVEKQINPNEAVMTARKMVTAFGARWTDLKIKAK